MHYDFEISILSSLSTTLFALLCDRALHEYPVFHISRRRPLRILIYESSAVPQQVGTFAVEVYDFFMKCSLLLQCPGYSRYSYHSRSFAGVGGRRLPCEQREPFILVVLLLVVWLTGIEGLLQPICPCIQSCHQHECNRNSSMKKYQSRKKHMEITPTDLVSVCGSLEET